ncbi:MAG: DUF302 domain-containing protein [Rhodopila sp.]|nr:DUF302 domain-containing protein [Rhodopila sp.]
MVGTLLPSPVEHISPVPFTATLKRLEQAIEAAGMTIFARVDHAAGARQVGMAMPPTVVLIYGSPRGGTPIMLAAPRAALDLPLRVLIREGAGGRTLVSFYPIASLLEASGVAGELAARLEPAQRVLVDALRP